MDDIKKAKYYPILVIGEREGFHIPHSIIYREDNCVSSIHTFLPLAYSLHIDARGPASFCMVGRTLSPNYLPRSISGPPKTWPTVVYQNANNSYLSRNVCCKFYGDSVWEGK